MHESSMKWPPKTCTLSQVSYVQHIVKTIPKDEFPRNRFSDMTCSIQCWVWIWQGNTTPFAIKIVLNIFGMNHCLLFYIFISSMKLPRRTTTVPFRNQALWGYTHNPSSHTSRPLASRCSHAIIRRSYHAIMESISFLYEVLSLNNTSTPH